MRVFWLVVDLTLLIVCGWGMSHASTHGETVANAIMLGWWAREALLDLVKAVRE